MPGRVDIGMIHTSRLREARDGGGAVRAVHHQVLGQLQAAFGGQPFAGVAGAFEQDGVAVMRSPNRRISGDTQRIDRVAGRAGGGR